MLALHEMCDPRRVDEVIAVTLPLATPRWLAAGPPRRVERFTGAQVTHIVSQGQPRRPARTPHARAPSRNHTSDRPPATARQSRAAAWHTMQQPLTCP